MTPPRTAWDNRRSFPHRSRSLPAYAFTIALSAFLFFLLQPIVARQILPWFGGSAAVWTFSSGGSDRIRIRPGGVGFRLSSQ